MTTVQHEFSVSGQASLSVQARSGSVSIQGEERTSILVTATLRSFGDLNADEAVAVVNECIVRSGDQGVYVEEPRFSGGGFLGWRRDAVDYEVLVPTDTSVRATCGSGDLRLNNVRSCLLKAGSGNVEVETVAEDCAVTTGSGDVSMTAVQGEAAVRTGSGSVRLRDVAGDARVVAASGDVTVAQPGGSVSISTASGDVEVRGPLQKSLRVNTASGDVTIAVPGDQYLYLDMVTMSGDVRTDLSPREKEPTEEARKATVSVRTASGDIDVRVLAEGEVSAG